MDQEFHFSTNPGDSAPCLHGDYGYGTVYQPTSRLVNIGSRHTLLGAGSGRGSRQSDRDGVGSTDRLADRRHGVGIAPTLTAKPSPGQRRPVTISAHGLR